MLQVEQKRRTWYKGRINVKVFEWRGNIFCNVQTHTDLQTLGEFPHGDPITPYQQLRTTRAGRRGIQKNPRPKALSCTKSEGPKIQRNTEDSRRTKHSNWNRLDIIMLESAAQCRGFLMCTSGVRHGC